MRVLLAWLVPILALLVACLCIPDHRVPAAMQLGFWLFTVALILGAAWITCLLVVRRLSSVAHDRAIGPHRSHQIWLWLGEPAAGETKADRSEKYLTVERWVHRQPRPCRQVEVEVAIPPRSNSEVVYAGVSVGGDTLPHLLLVIGSDGSVLFKHGDTVVAQFPPNTVTPGHWCALRLKRRPDEYWASVNGSKLEPAVSPTGGSFWPAKVQVKLRAGGTLTSDPQCIFSRPRIW